MADTFAALGVARVTEDGRSAYRQPPQGGDGGHLRRTAEQPRQRAEQIWLLGHLHVRASGL
eukprot:3152834-Pyramimonas_sp.AAC.1